MSAPHEQRLLQSVLKRTTERPDEANAEVLHLNNLLSTIKQLDMDLVTEIVEKAKRPIDRAIEELRSENRKVRRVLKKKKKKSHPVRDPKGVRGGKMHHKTKRKKELEYRRRREYTQQKENLAKQVEKHGWYALYRARWTRRGAKRITPGWITRDQWDKYIEPHLSYEAGGTQPRVSRIDTSKGFTLENVVVTDRATNRVLFDGGDLALSRVPDILID